MVVDRAARHSGVRCGAQKEEGSATAASARDGADRDYRFRVQFSERATRKRDLVAVTTASPPAPFFRFTAPRSRYVHCIGGNRQALVNRAVFEEQVRLVGDIRPHATSSHRIDFNIVLV